MSKNSEYKIVSGYGLTLLEACINLESAVNCKISLGWEPSGGVSFVRFNGICDSFAYQAMIKKG